MSTQKLEFESPDTLLYLERPISEYVEGISVETIMWTQRKLLLSNIQFLTLFWNPAIVPNPVVVYNGASPGNHIPYLANMFPDVQFHCYGADFEIQATEQIKLYQEQFTDETAQYWSTSHNKLYFISDVLSLELQYWESEKIELETWKYLNKEREWLDVMKPVHSSLRFRLPYPQHWKKIVTQSDITTLGFKIDPLRPDVLPYLGGYAFLQPWTAKGASDVRLTPLDHDIEWSVSNYDGMSSYHNNIERTKLKYLNPITKNIDILDSPELLDDYDSTLEIYILMSYLSKVSLAPTSEYVVKLSRSITEELTKVQRDPALPHLNSLSNIRAADIKAYDEFLWKKKPEVLPTAKPRIKRIIRKSIK